MKKFLLTLSACALVSLLLLPPVLAHRPALAQKLALQLAEAVKTLLILEDAGCHELHHIHH